MTRKNRSQILFFFVVPGRIHEKAPAYSSEDSSKPSSEHTSTAAAFFLFSPVGCSPGSTDYMSNVCEMFLQLYLGSYPNLNPNVNTNWLNPNQFGRAQFHTMLERWRLTMTIIVLQELTIYYQIDASSIIEL